VTSVRVLTRPDRMIVRFRALPGDCSHYDINSYGNVEFREGAFDVRYSYTSLVSTALELSKARAVAAARGYARRIARLSPGALRSDASCEGPRISDSYTCDAELVFAKASGGRYSCFYGVQITRPSKRRLHVEGVGGLATDDSTIDALRDC
jgi:hypothetical protein